MYRGPRIHGQGTLAGLDIWHCGLAESHGNGCRDGFVVDASVAVAPVTSATN